MRLCVLLLLLLACASCASPSDGEGTPETPDGQSPETVEVDLLGPPALALSPTSPRTEDALIASLTLPDGADGEQVRWYVDGALAAEGRSVPAARTAKGQTWLCEARAGRGGVLGEPAEGTLVIVDTPPEIRALTLSTLTPAPGETVTVESLTSFDADLDPVTLTLSWRLDGREVGSGFAWTAEGPRGATVTLEVTPTADGVDGPVFASDPIVITNAPPTLSGVALSPAAPNSTDALTCLALDPFDLEGDPITLSYAWEVNDLPLSDAEASIPAQPRGTRVRCVVTPSDPFGAGQAYPSAVVTIANAPPIVHAVTLSPAAPTSADTLTCQAEASDPDDDALTLTYTWRADDLPLDATGPTLAGLTAEVAYTCRVRAGDGQALSSPLDSAPVTARNAPPVIGPVLISPEAPRRFDTLHATAPEAFDPDGDPFTLTFAWRDGETLLHTGPTLPNQPARGGTSLTLEVQADDARSPLGPSSGTLTVPIANTPPTITDLAIVPASPRVTDGLTASFVAADADEDPLSVSTRWQVRGDSGPARDLTGPSLSPGLALKGQTVHLLVTVEDGSSSTTETAEVTIANSPPSPPQLAIDPDPGAATCTPLICRVVAPAEDADTADTLTYSFQWSLNGAPLSGSAATTEREGDTLPASALFLDQRWTCEATVSDGETTASASATAAEGATMPGVLDGVPMGVTGACVLTPGGRLDCFGYPHYGRPWIHPPAALEGLTFDELHAANTQVCAREAETGRYHCFGEWNPGTAQASAMTSPPPGAFEGIRTTAGFGCVFDEAGARTCWGPSLLEERLPPEDLEVFDFDLANNGSCAVLLDRTLACWSPDTRFRDLAQALPGRHTRVRTTWSHVCALRTDGEIHCASSAPSDPNGLLSPPEGPFVGLFLDSWGTGCGLRPSGALSCWGRLTRGGTMEFPPRPSFRVAFGVVCWMTSAGRFECDPPREAQPMCY